MQVILSEAELERCERCAAIRTNHARNNGIPNQRVASKKSDLTVDYIGLVGELAVAKYLDVDIELEKEGIDNGIDLIYGDLTVDVKTRSFPGNDLVFKSHKAFKAQVAILAQFNLENCVEILGCMSRNKFKKHATPTSYGCLRVSEESLYPIESLIGYTQEKS
jgi:hypothetical protein